MPFCELFVFPRQMPCDVYEFKYVLPRAQTYSTSSISFHWDSLLYFSLYANRFGERRSVRVDNKCLCGYDQRFKSRKSLQNEPDTSLLESAFVPCLSLELEIDKLNRCVSLAISTLTVANVAWRDVRLYDQPFRCEIN